MNALHTSWQSAWARIGIANPDVNLFHELLLRYAEPHRKYHTKQHLEECLAHLPELCAVAAQPAEVAIALWFHDAIYSTVRHDNEERSAQWALSAIGDAGGNPIIAERVYQLIMATRHHVSPSTLDEQVVVDIDLSILGADAPRFDQYELQIREEYAAIPTFLFRRKRRAVLEGFLHRPRIFNTQCFFDLYEVPAHENLCRSISVL